MDFAQFALKRKEVLLLATAQYFKIVSDPSLKIYSFADTSNWQ